VNAKPLEWPKEPYRGLEYYRAEDRLLFTGRENAIDDCIHLVADPQTRILMLHGQTGCGKSSFLRAGLIPGLEERAIGYFFLREYSSDTDTDGSPAFIRCGTDPMGRISEQLYKFSSKPISLNSVKGLETHDLSGAQLKCESIQEFVETCRKPGKLLEALHALSESCPRTLVLILDQAEEVITLGETNTDYRKQFFRFIRDFSSTNFPLKIVLALRKDYSGEFLGMAQLGGSVVLLANKYVETELPKGMERDPLVKADIKLYLLPELDKVAVLSAITRPTDTTKVGTIGSPIANYKFSFAPGVAEPIVEELFKTTASNAVLPVMQIVCRDLYEDVMTSRNAPVEITLARYGAGKRISGPVDRHITKSLRASFDKGLTGEELEREEVLGRELLYRLVRRESDGSVHTNIISFGAFATFAVELGLRSNTEKVVEHLTQPAVLLLRVLSGLSAIKQGDPRLVSLGHDVIGLVLKEWKIRLEEAAERLRIEQEARDKLRKAQLITGGWILGLFLLASAIALSKYREQDAFTLQVLERTAETKRHQAPILAMTAAAHATNVTKHLRRLEFWKLFAKPDVGPTSTLLKMAYGMPTRAVALSSQASDSHSNAGTSWLIPLGRAAGFVTIKQDGIDVVRNVTGARTAQHYGLGSANNTNARSWKIGDVLAKEGKSGDVRLLLRPAESERQGGQFELLILRPDGATLGPYDARYFGNAIRERQKERTNEPIISTNLSDNTMSVYSIETNGDVKSDVYTRPSLNIATFVFDAEGSIDYPLSLGQIYSSSLFLVGEAILDGYRLRIPGSSGKDSEPSNGASNADSVQLVVEDMKNPQRLPPRLIDLNNEDPRESCRDEKANAVACTWTWIPRNAAPDTLVLLGAKKADVPDSSSSQQFGNVDFNHFQRLLFVDISNGRKLDVDFDGVKKKCAPWSMVAGSGGGKYQIISAGDVDAVILGFITGLSVDVAKIANDDGHSVYECLGTLYLMDEVRAWAVTGDDKTLFATSPSGGADWDIANAIEEKVEQALNSPRSAQVLDVRRVACDSGLGEQELKGDAWTDATGLDMPAEPFCKPQ
jgi:hypothetical protein